MCLPGFHEQLQLEDTLADIGGTGADAQQVG